MMRSVVLFLVVLSSLLSADDSVQVKTKKVGSEVVVVGENRNPFSITVAYRANFKNLSPNKKMPHLLGENATI